MTAQLQRPGTSLWGRFFLTSLCAAAVLMTVGCAASSASSNQNNAQNASPETQETTGAAEQEQFKAHRQEITTEERALLEKEWSLIELAPFSVHHLIKAQATLDLRNLPRVSAYMGCNQIMTQVMAVGGGTVKVSPVMATRMRCEDMAVENAFVQAADRVYRYEVDETTLRLWTQDGQMLRFTLAP